MNLDRLGSRVEGLRHFINLTSPHLPPPRLDPARALVDRAGERLALSRAHTVVALAGATGSGKSSIFNALAGQDLSPVGLRRPTTGAAHSAVWGAEPARELLDWLGVGHRFGASTMDGLDGLVLLDLPDFDSVQREHRIEADRLLGLVDLIVWVLDPQKYADRVLHRQYLSQFGHHRDITVVALHQADRLDDASLNACLTDLSRLLSADGLSGVPILATSTVGRPGLGQLHAVLEKTVASRVAALQRLSADTSAVVADLSPLVSSPLPPFRPTELYGALSVAAGVPVVADAAQRSYVHQAVRHTGWPVTRWVRRFRSDPLGRLHLPSSSGSPASLTAATSIGPAAPAATAAVGLALRSVGDRAGAGLPDPWPSAMLDAARSHVDDLPDALDVAVARTDLGLGRTPTWWRLVGGLHWLLVLGALAGLLWLVLRYVLFALALPSPPSPSVGQVPLFTLLFAGGLLGGLVLAALTRPIVSAAARRRARRVRSRLDASVRAVGDDLVLAPVARARDDYAAARQTLAAAR